jgi:hypothetical protein
MYVPVELGLRDVPDDQKVNLGASLLRSVLSKWAHAFSSLHLAGAPLPGLDEPGAEQMPRFSSDLPPAGEGGCLGWAGLGCAGRGMLAYDWRAGQGHQTAGMTVRCVGAL